MVTQNAIDTLVGGVVLAIAAALLAIVYTSSRIVPISGYVMTARFGGVDGLKPGSDVRISGVKVGRVIDTTIDTTTYQAVVRFSMDESVKLPIDTKARVASGSLMGNIYLELQPGHETELIASGGEIPISQTEVPTNILDLIGRFVFQGRGNNPQEQGPSRGVQQQHRK